LHFEDEVIQNQLRETVFPRPQGHAEQTDEGVLVLVRAEKHPELPGGLRMLIYNLSIKDLVIGTHSNLGLKMGEARRSASRG